MLLLKTKQSSVDPFFAHSPQINKISKALINNFVFKYNDNKDETYPCIASSLEYQITPMHIASRLAQNNTFAIRFMNPIVDLRTLA